MNRLRFFSLIVFMRAVFSLKLDKNGIPALTKDEYKMLPTLTEMDLYQDCLDDADGVYCLASFQLIPAENHELYKLLKNISSYDRIYYNRTRVYRGVCLSRCENYSQSAQAPADALSACVNSTIHRRYGLGATVHEIDYCKRPSDEIPVDVYDYAFLLAAGGIVLLNLIGSIRWAWWKEDKVGWLSAFSIQQNWRKLTVIRGENFGDQRLSRLRSIQGLRSISMSFVILGHVMLVPLYHMPPHNAALVEQLPEYVIATLVYSGYLLMQTFLVLGSFLLAFNLKVMLNGKRFTWKMLLAAFVQRVIRLVPSYMLVVWFSGTWAARLSAGPLCPLAEKERETCRDKWWTHLLFLHNVIRPGPLCLGQTWYLAVDMQLFVLSLIFLKLTWKKPVLARAVLFVSLALATLMQFVLVYFYDLLPPQMMQTPEALRTLFKSQPSFWYLYTTLQGNIQGYLVGLLLAFVYYEIQRDMPASFVASKWFKWLYRLSFPVGFCWMLAVHPLLRTGATPLSLAVYAMADRLVFACLIAVLLLGTFSTVGSLYGSILDWSGWRTTGRLSLSALLLHVLVILPFSCSNPYPRHMRLYGVIYDWISTVVLTYAASIPLTLLVEFPTQHLQKILTAGAVSTPEVPHKGGGKKNTVDVNENLVKECISNGASKKIN